MKVVIFFIMLLTSIYGSPLHKLQENEYFPNIRVKHKNAIKNPHVKKLFDYFGGAHKVPGYMWHELLFNASRRSFNSHPVHQRKKDPYHHTMKYEISNFLHARNNKGKKSRKPGTDLYTLKRKLKDKAEQRYKKFNENKNKNKNN